MLGTGLNGKVYLVNHKELNVFRAMKVIPKDNKGCYKEYKKEAMILKELKYPGIPVIYDMEEAKEYLYLIEEYISGETLYERVNSTGILTREEIINLGINLCRPIIYLHNQKEPILHLDIHPGNLIIHNDDISLIDFDHARYKIKGLNLSDGYGNKNFAAPEQRISAKVDITTDIYAIGAIMYYAGTGQFPNEHFDLPMSWGSELNKIIRSCLYYDRDFRISSVEKLKNSLENIKANKKASRNIAIVGSAKGVGTTYISLGLTSFLMSNNISSIYEEHNESGHMNLLMQNCVREYDEYGTFRINNVYISPYSYKENKTKARHSASVYIKDYGNDINAAIKSEADLLLLICGSNTWQIEDNKTSINKISQFKNHKIIYNLCSNQNIIYKISHGLSFNFPYVANIMENKKERDEIFKKVVEDILDIRSYKKSMLEKFVENIGL